ncbi:nitrogenase molybdenum-iron protein alpha chain [Sporobacter termitidis DSM 10068]|uniref:Nitrogenase molybdenum-iron protein alpha chain n=1 Tax=Sporobacter termitidis DSM 10068 TaxID=1123282 RepID=A0A1M5XFA9_9FIRM|nr:nitrogenase component 1 [Sporobacter termitidis]SHH98555.1 nitrogenase molybdenum-iron protein alpha chain [Sporobacter termitidis DSM 10068]
MSYLQNKEPPTREARLGACIVYGGTLCDLAGKGSRCGCLQDGSRSFSQGSICLLLPGISILNTLPDNVNLVHGAVGCGACSHSQNANTRSGGNLRTGAARDAVWLSTALNETDVISGAENKLYNAILEADRLYRPKTITVVVSCVPSIIGDDVDGVIERARPHVAARIVPVHCEGFKTKIWATAYDAVYHGLARALFEDPKWNEPIIRDDLYEERLAYRKAHTVNLLTVSSMGLADEQELTRYLNALDQTVNVFPNFADPDKAYALKYAGLSVSTCPTHDDYLLDYLREEYGVPYIIRHMPIGIDNTSAWIRDIAAQLGKSGAAERLIERETAELNAALEKYRPFFKGKRVFISAGEFRALATANLLHDLGFDIAGIRSFHHDEFANVEYEKLLKNAGEDLMINIANVQPFEEANLLRTMKPDLFLGHWNDNSTATKLGIPSHVIYNTGLAYIGYRGAFELARRLYRQLASPAFNKNLSKFVRLPYKDDWYGKNPFAYIKSNLDLPEDYTGKEAPAL